MRGKDGRQKPWRLVEAALAVPRPLGAACAVFGVLALAGYVGNVQVLYRPIAGGPASHPLTAVAVVLLGLGVTMCNRTRSGTWFARVSALLVLWITVSRLAEVALGIDLTSWMTPFNAQVLLDRATFGRNSMGVNTAIMLLSIASALGLHSVMAPRLSQLAASVAVAVPAVAFTGYAYGLGQFYGQMSLLTALTGLGLAIAALAMTADHAGLKALLSPYLGGRIARLQALAGYLIPTLLGYFLVSSLVSGAVGEKGLFGIYVVAIGWFIILMSSIAAVFHEKVDFARRQGESELAAAATTDSLTGLPNRRQFFEVGERETERIKRTGSDLWILMIDLDHFKKINDTAGHAMGDRILMAVSQLLSQSIRKVDLVARLGGDEFAVLLTDTQRVGCERAAECIRHGIEMIDVPEWTDVDGPVTASIGGANFGRSSTLDEAMASADEALYLSKAGGRNRVVLRMDSERELSERRPPEINASRSH